MVFLKNKLEQQIKNVFQMICFNYGYELLEIDVMPDHCYLFISAPPTIAPVDIVMHYIFLEPFPI